MQKLQLFISDTRVDLFKDESVTITQTIQNIKDIAKISTEFTQTFTIPASKTNNKDALGEVYNVGTGTNHSVLDLVTSA